MKSYITSKKNFYKANLHNHSTATDGRLTPEEIKSLKHAEQALTNGYDMASNRTQRTVPVGGLRSWYNSTYPGTDTAIV